MSSPEYSDAVTFFRYSVTAGLNLLYDVSVPGSWVQSPEVQGPIPTDHRRIFSATNRQLFEMQKDDDHDEFRWEFNDSHLFSQYFRLNLAAVQCRTGVGLLKRLRIGFLVKKKSNHVKIAPFQHSVTHLNSNSFQFSKFSLSILQTIPGVSPF